VPLPHLQIRPSSIHDRRRLSVSFSRRLSKIFTNLINTMPAKSCPLDPMLLKRLILHIAPVICHLCHLSLHSGVFPTKLKQTLVLPLLKKNNLDPETASSYGPISNLPYISKVIERVVARRFSSQLSHHSLLPARQSAYCTFHPLYRNGCVVGTQRHGTLHRQRSSFAARVT